jgi:hypothetical protein
MVINAVSEWSKTPDNGHFLRCPTPVVDAGEVLPNSKFRDAKMLLKQRYKNRPFKIGGIPCQASGHSLATIKRP